MMQRAIDLSQEMTNPDVAAAETLRKVITDKADLLRQLQQKGYLHLTDWRGPAPELADHFGTVIQITDVAVDEESTSLVTSHRGLDVHTDHSRARYILWECRTQSVTGGVSVLVDTREIITALSQADREALKQVHLTEHQVFRDDSSRAPLLRTIDGEERVYYSFWLLEDEVPENCRGALTRFREALESAPETRLSLEPGDLLIIDNHRMLHGRTEIEKASQRHLVRYWISDQARPAAPAVRPSKERRGPKCPPPIKADEVARFISIGVDPDVAAIDLSMVKMKMQEPDEGKGWTAAHCDAVELEYKRFLTLNLRYPERAIVPTKEMDEMWHYHIMDTRAYHADCDRVFGEYFHHFPYFGMRSDDDEAELKAAFEETCDLYLHEFDEELLRAAGAQKCWHDCKGRCWHACKSK